MTDERPDTLAEEYAVGLLDEVEARAVERRMARDPAFARAVAAARDRFLEIDMTEPVTTPDTDAWAAIEGRLAAGAEADAAGHEPAGDDDGTVVPLRRTGGVRRVWKPAALLATAASLLLALGLVWQVSRPQPVAIAVLLDASGEPRAVVEAFADDHVVVKPMGDLPVPQGRTLQVWTLPQVPDARPVSLGLIEQVRRLELRGPDLPPPVPGQLYEITIEPEGGSPTGGPTGPIVGKGFAKDAL